MHGWRQKGTRDPHLSRVRLPRFSHLPQHLPTLSQPNPFPFPLPQREKTRRRLSLPLFHFFSILLLFFNLQVSRAHCCVPCHHDFYRGRECCFPLPPIYRHLNPPPSLGPAGIQTDEEEMGDEDEEKKSGCGLLVLYNSVFRRSSNASTPRRSSSSSAIPSPSPTASAAADPDELAHSNSKRRRAASEESSLLVSSSADINPSELPLATKPPFSYPQVVTAPASHFQKPTARKQQQPDNGRALQGPLGRMPSISSELDSIIHDHQRSKGSSTLVRASSGNVMLFGNLGNIRAPGAVTSNRNVVPEPKTTRELLGSKVIATATNEKKLAVNGTTGREAEAPEVLCRALSKRLDSEELKEMGNEEYKQGRYAEAVALYDRAILVNPEIASYYSNKAAALIGLGQLIEAVSECKEAIRIDPSYGRAHHRLATLYLRLGEASKAIQQYKLSRKEATMEDISRAQSVLTNLSKCNEARKLEDWHSMLKETKSAVSAGADSAPQVFALQAEALLKLHRHEEAETASNSAPRFDMDASTKFFGSTANAYFLAVRAQVNMAAGRFEDAVALAHRAAKLDPSSREVGAVARKARTVASARSMGNDLFKASRFEDASMAYGEGLATDAQNAILLCNRAACRSKLGQWEKAIEDCSAALKMRPSYSKARLRRADCNAKLERWEAAVQDYEVLQREMPDDEELGKALSEAQVKLQKGRGQGIIVDTKSRRELVNITSEDQFRNIVESPRLSVALFFNKWSEVSKREIPLMQQLCNLYPSTNFLQVDLEENEYLAESEFISSVPSYKLYKNGSTIKDIAGSDNDHLESFIKDVST